MNTTHEFYNAVDTAHAHPGGRLARWHRMMSRNSYTIDPNKPEPDRDDLEQRGLLAVARLWGLVWMSEDEYAISMVSYELGGYYG